MKKIFLIIAIISSLIACETVKNAEQLHADAENVALLNGNWKFNALAGQGTNPMNVVEEEGDIIIDNLDSELVEVKGKWRTKKVGARGTDVYKENYFERNFKAGESAENYVRFYLKNDETSYYEAFAMYPFGSHTTAQFNVKHSGGKTPKHFLQRSNNGKWMSLGIYKFNKNEENYVEVTAITDGGVVADAVMFKPISEEFFLKTKKDAKEVFQTNFDDSDWKNLKVPGHWGMINDYSNYNGFGWYRKAFKLPENWSQNANERIRIKFEGVYHVCKVYLNDELIGENRGGFTPFEFDITNKLNYGKANVIAVEVDNRNIVGATWNWGGIIRDVYLTKNNEVRINNQNIHANPDLAKGSADLKLKVRLENNSEVEKEIAVKSVVSRNGELLELTKTVKVPANKIIDEFLEGKLASKDVALWHFDHPNLYEIKTTISEGETVIDSRKDNFGIRKIELTASKLLLNGEPVRLGGFNRVSEHRYWGSSEPLQVLEEDVDLMKEAGANFMRIMHGTQNEKLIDLCDKKGILLFEEVNVRNLTNPEFTAPEYPLIKKWITGMVERDWNHPSIIGWSIGNELSNHYDYAKYAMDFTRELDPNRLLTCVSNSGQKSFSNRKTDPNTEVDLIMHNMYRWQGTPQEIIDKLRSEWPEKPIFISEYGFDPYPTTSLDGDQQIVSDWNQHWRGKNDFVIGASMWTFNDYRSAYAATSEEENRVWGLIDVWRNKRRLFHRVEKEFSPIKNIVVENIDLSKGKASVEMPIRGLNDYPSYSLQGYKLEWDVRNKGGKVVAKNAKELPLIKPGNKVWKGDIHWNKTSNDVLDLRVRLISANGYQRYEKVIPFTVPLSPKITGIDVGDKSVRVWFKKVAGADEYLVEYKNEGETVRSFKTITNAVEIDGLTNGKAVDFSVIAINEKGESQQPNSISGTPNGKPLAPKVWKSFIEDNKIVIGYTSEKQDDFYVVKYGTSKDNLDEEFRSNVRGMMTIDLENESEVYFQIQREIKGQKGNWSAIIKAN
ncbi:beta-galactosidase [Lutibacter oricola]|uniref:Beta-galactosidase n=1 Tax=Lutibacter oricola TaxID=762486 RepID=A0A1H3FD79_9FLAO|nr:glycoside hydrolase family 2 TIM barrel-domain containing protein [Lutibacter oricola]SDX88962.1 beta-galactosidase [Lutibacter oricola]